eukprot:1522758-Pyramimonas_sp.AAC.1
MADTDLYRDVYMTTTSTATITVTEDPITQHTPHMSGVHAEGDLKLSEMEALADTDAQGMSAKEW